MFYTLYSNDMNEITTKKQAVDENKKFTHHDDYHLKVHSPVPLYEVGNGRFI
jgi:hypothetical protein